MRNAATWCEHRESLVAVEGGEHKGLHRGVGAMVGVVEGGPAPPPAASRPRPGSWRCAATVSPASPSQPVRRIGFVATRYDLSTVPPQGE